MKLYGYYRSSAAYRVRIALNLKGLAYQSVPVNLLRGEQGGEDYAQVNPQQLVPSLVLDDGAVLTQSGAILEYLEARYPEPALLPTDPVLAAQLRAACQVIGCDIHPIANLRVQNYLQAELGVEVAQKGRWIRHWIGQGFGALERQLATKPAWYSEQANLLDLYLIPQIYNARRFELDMAPYPHLLAAEARCGALPAFVDALPQHQPDAV
ncbi:maleylacetoacetate isomerase [Ferrimonas pelagia]|uniref:Maleylacetoacetate isomerase n=1 Tax=Ferrimonas pelagia TaxID=1177826 RepID=A0ABP9EM48_9GAMM